MQNQKGITSALAILLVFIVVFVAAVYYLAGPPASTISARHAYFEDLSFQLDSNKTWRVAAPISQDGNLHLWISSDAPITLYVKNGNSYLLDTTVTGAGNFTIQVTQPMAMLEVGVINSGNQLATIQQFTCVWTS